MEPITVEQLLKEVEHRQVVLFEAEHKRIKLGLNGVYVVEQYPFEILETTDPTEAVNKYNEL